MAVFAVVAQAGSIAAPGPVVLFSDRFGAAFTYDIKSDKSGNYTMSKRAVSLLEINAIRAQGVAVALRADPGSGPVTEGLDASIPSSFSIIRRYGNVYGNFWIGGSRPANTTTQWVTFDYVSYSYIDEHVPISLFLDASAAAASPPWIVGNGMILGYVYGRTANDGGCGSASWPSVPIYNSQVEAFWAGGNWIYGASCHTAGYQDGTTYNFTLHASTGGWVAQWTNLGYSPAIYTLNERPSWNPDNGGIFFGSTNGSPSGGDFTLYFTNVLTDWF